MNFIIWYVQCTYGLKVIVADILIHLHFQGSPLLDLSSEADYINTENNELLECIINEENEGGSSVVNAEDLKLEPVDDYGPPNSIRLDEIPRNEDSISGVKSENFKPEPVDYHEPMESVEPGEADEWHDVNLNSAAAVPVPFYPGVYIMQNTMVDGRKGRLPKKRKCMKKRENWERNAVKMASRTGKTPKKLLSWHIKIVFASPAAIWSAGGIINTKVKVRNA